VTIVHAEDHVLATRGSQCKGCGMLLAVAE